MTIGTLQWSEPQGNLLQVGASWVELRPRVWVWAMMDCPTQQSRVQPSPNTHCSCRDIAWPRNGTFDACVEFIHKLQRHKMWPRCNEIELRVAKCVEWVARQRQRERERQRLREKAGRTQRQHFNGGIKILCCQDKLDCRCHSGNA